MLHPYITAAIMGLVEGLTEFLPVSSTGHLILAGALLDYSGETAKTFSIFIQSGAILAVVLAYRDTFLGLLRKPAGGGGGLHGLSGVGLLFLTTLPALVAGLLAHGFIKERLFSPDTVAVGLAAGAVWILVAERLPRAAAPRGLDRLTWRTALAIGCYQCLALWPGVSRSTCTILGGLALGLDRKAATEYSFFAAVPLLAAACVYDLAKSIHLLHAGDLPVFAIGFLVAFVSAWLAIRFFIRFVARHTLAAFGWYRLLLAGLVVWLM